MSPSERREMIRKENTKLSLTRQCKLLKISRSSIYYAPVGVNAKTLKLMHEIDRVFTKHRSLEAARLLLTFLSLASQPDDSVFVA